MDYINLNTWKRKKHFDFFRKFDYPHFNICADIEITETYKYVKQNKLSIFPSVLFAVMKTCNHFEEFRYRITGKRIKIYDKVHPGITLLVEGDVYGNCLIEYKDNYKEFLNLYNTAVTNAKKKLVIGEKQKNRDDLIYISSLPWLSFTSVTNPAIHNATDSIPRIIWGKQFRRGKKILMPLSVQVNHCLMDGIHVSKYFFKLREFFSEPEKTFR